MKRRAFIERSSLAAAGLMLGNVKASGAGPQGQTMSYTAKPLVISTWDFGFDANEEAWKLIGNSSNALDAVEMGIRRIEADPLNHSVGYGGFPDRDGNVTLDACIMAPDSRAGSVAFLKNIMHPISVARRVMENTPHVMLAGEGALKFAKDSGFEEVNLLTAESIKAWEKWKKEADYHPVINIENHDTIGMLCLDVHGDLAGGCSTSGLAYKMHGRVGDSPIIGAALYLDNAIGAAVTTGLGEMVMRSLTSFLVVELMHHGASPQSACEEAIHRIVRKNPEYVDNQVGVIALSPSGETGAFAVQKGFNYACKTSEFHKVINSDSYLK
jgi:isoaspartyl peptidase/L-asparaginase-like protein (Ntn-hydrolase superfamily)